MAVWTEKRAYQRFVHREPIGYAYRPIEKFYRAEMVNDSEGGAYFKSVVALRPGQNVYVRIDNLSQDSVLPEQYEGYHAEVRYCKKLGKADDRFYGIGVQYLLKFSTPILPEKQAKTDLLRRQAEAYPGRIPESFQEWAPEDIHKLINELHVHQIELEMQNDELRWAQQEITTSRDKYSDLYEFAPNGYFTVGQNGRILEVNLTGASLLGVARHFLINTGFSLFVAPDSQDAFYFHRKRVFETKIKHNCELKLVKKDGTLFYAQMESMAVPDADSNLNRMRCTITDVSPRKQEQEALRKSHDELERRVAERTKELSQVNAQLRRQIEVRQQGGGKAAPGTL